MAIGRGRFTNPYVSTKGHSVLKQRSYVMPTRTPLSTGVPRASSGLYDTRAEEYLLSDRVNSVNYLSSSLLDEGYDTAKKSRGRDQQLLQEATNAIPRGSVRETAAVTSSAAPFGVRHFPSRFGRARLRTSQSSRIYPPRVEGEQASSCSTSDLMASPGPAPAGRWRHFGRTRSARSYFGDDDTSPERSTYSSRASPIGSPPARTVPHPHRHTPVPAMRRSLPPLPLTNLSESKVLDKGSTTSWGQSLSPTRASVTSSSALPEYRPLDVDYEPQPVKPVPRRRQRVLGSTRRPAGNYYERLLKKRGRRQGRLGPYYDVESIEGSDLSGVLSDVDSYEGTYDNDSDYESSSVSPSTYRQLPSSVSPSSPYYVDQDTEFVPFKPSRPLLTKGLLEVTPYGNESNGNECSNSEALPSPTTDLSLSRYVPSSLVSAATSVSRPPLPRPSYRSVVPYTSPVSKSTVDLSPSPSQKLLESLVTSSVERARSAINNLAIPEYRGASLVLSVEGAGVSPDGKKVDFTYTPPPIPLYGRSLSLNDSVLGIRPASSVKPVDKFISGYMERMDALKAELNSRLDKDKERRLQYGLKPLDTGPRPSRSRTPSYTQSHEYVPVKDLTSERLEQLPVTTFRRQQDDGQTERVDVFSLGEFRPRLSSSATRAITIPESATGGYQLSVIDKINIKAAIIASKLEPDPLKRRRPRSEYAANKYRELRKEAQESAYGGRSGYGGSYSSSQSAERRRR